jgi:hypothetical protein
MGANNFAPKHLFIISKDISMGKEKSKETTTGSKVLVGKASLLIGKKRIMKGDRVLAEEVNALPNKLKVLFADETKAAESLKPDKKKEEDEQ